MDVGDRAADRFGVDEDVVVVAIIVAIAVVLSSNVISAEHGILFTLFRQFAVLLLLF